jgi:hypothetical protein
VGSQDHTWPNRNVHGLEDKKRYVRKGKKALIFVYARDG